MHKVVFVVKGKRQVEFLAGQRENLLEAARKAGIMIDTPCNGNGTCGKCKVQIIKGRVDALSLTRLTEEEIADGWVLACSSEIIEDIEVNVPDLASAFQNEMQITDLSENENKKDRKSVV